MDEARNEQRNRWVAAKGFIPTGLRNNLTDAEIAAVAVHAAAAAAAKKGYHDLSTGQVAWLAGVSETSVRAANRKIRELGLVSIEGTKVRITDPDWLALLRLIAGSGEISVEP